MGKNLILGVGNLLLTDEGIGIHAVRKLLEMNGLPEDLEIVDGGTAGLDLLYYLEGVDRLVIVDAVETGGHQAPLSGWLETRSRLTWR
jgi:hydrogenase maturation protease